MDTRGSDLQIKGATGRNLARSGLLARNTFYSLLGQVIPLAVAFVSIPLIIKGLGVDRFGVLSLVWVVVGYFSLFNLGIGRATKKYVSEYLGRGDTEGLPELVWGSLAMLALLGAIAGILLAAFNPFLVTDVLNIQDNLKPETLKALYLLALCLPVTLASDGARGVLEGQQRFGIVNAVKIPAGILSFVAPLVVLLFSGSLVPITAALCVNRLAAFLAYFYLCITSIPGMKRATLPEMSHLRKLLGFGGWLTISNLISPLMACMDRFIVASVLTMSAVAYYSTPYDLVTKLQIIPGSLLSVVFPAMSATFAVDTDRFALLYERSLKYIMMALSPLILILVTFAAPFLRFWLGAAFAHESAWVLQLLAVGVLVNSVAMVPSAAIQAMNRPDLTAKAHIIELPVYAGMIWLFIGKMGIVGVALSWLLRVSIDLIVLSWFANKTISVRISNKNSWLFTLVCIVLGLLLITYVTISVNCIERSIVLAACLCMMAIVFVHFLLEHDETTTICSMVNAKIKKYSL